MTTQNAERAHLTTVAERDLPALISGRRTAMVVLSPEPRDPIGPAECGDLVYLATGPGRVTAGARIERIDRYDDLTFQDLRMLRESHGARTIGDGSAWTDQPDARSAAVVWLADIRPVEQADAVPAELLGPSSDAWRSTKPTPSAAERAA
ncbi:MAG: hypothetical protein LAT64_00305 [Phycisphaerales bacterium]|nr:hypothetical protein [Planctomycetota bacterium]MCH8507203.1 hypothetical protein [Phycisphaerales bacterium]